MSPTAGYKRRERYCPGSLHRGEGERFRSVVCYLDRSTPNGIRAECLNGDFVALRSKVLEWAGKEAFVFFFIDPKGWKDIGIDTLRPLLERPRSRVSGQLMYNDIKRCGNQRRSVYSALMDANSGNRYANSFAEAYVGESSRGR